MCSTKERFNKLKSEHFRISGKSLIEYPEQMIVGHCHNNHAFSINYLQKSRFSVLDNYMNNIICNQLLRNSVFTE